MNAIAHHPLAVPDGRLAAPSAQRGVRVSAVALVAAALLALAGWRTDAHAFAFAYLIGFVVKMTIGVGALALLLLQHLTRAGWSAAARRQLEWIASVLVVGPVLFLPLLGFGSTIYEWMRPEARADALIAKKAAYLNLPAFAVRGLVFLALWAALAHVFARRSRRQDDSERPAEHTAWMQRWSAPAVLVVGLSVSFAGFDWLMSLDPRWYSTIFGVYVIAGALVGALAVLAILTIVLERRGVYGPVSTVEHRHDIAKLLFGFTCFWAYIAFCQFFLIWYAGLPEETIFFQRRWVGSWQSVTLLLAIGHFALPFVVLIGRTAKRSVPVLLVSAAWLLGMHVVDIYWLVAPVRDTAGVHVGLPDLGGLLLPLCVLALVIARHAAREPAFPVRDPRLAEAIRSENP